MAKTISCYCTLYNSIQDKEYTVKKVDGKVRHPERSKRTTVHNSRVTNKFSDFPVENFTINIELFRQIFTNVKLLRPSRNVSKAAPPDLEPASFTFPICLSTIAPHLPYTFTIQE